MERKRVSIVVPCYNEEETITILYDRLEEVTAKLVEYDFEYLFVDDGSRDLTKLKMIDLAQKDTKVSYISFSRNFGKEAAILAGLSHAKGDYVATMDADLQDPPELLGEMLAILETGEYDNVASRRVSREGEPLIRSACARAFYGWMRKLTKIQIADGARDYRLMSRQMVDSILAMTEYNRFSKGIFAWVGYRTKWLEFENVQRVAGETKWSFLQLLHYSLDGIINFSNAPLMIASYLGLFFTLIAFIAILFIVIRALLFGDPVAGWPSTVCIITFIGGIQLFCMGIMGQYLSKLYMEVKKRPHYIIGQTNIADAKMNS